MEISNSVVTLKPGIYILRHPKGKLPPLSISRAPADASHSGRIEALWTPGTQGAVLRDGSDCIVMHVLDAPVELLVSAFLAHAGDAKPALRIDRVSLDQAGAEAALAPAAAAAPAAPQPGRPIEISPQGLSLIGHMERNGDAVAAEGQYLGKPDANLRLEGFQLMWPDRPQGVDLAYSVSLEGSGALPTVTTGQFCGTRGNARRITEVTFTLVGEQAHRFALHGVAHFSGGFMVPVVSGLPLSGPSGMEHLTAIKLAALPATQAEAQAPNPWAKSARTKVFKAGATGSGKQAGK
ncbi:hypothetical protein ASD15_15275 [Massilia sp. Root351]|jgi:hypothetical protein|uniref:hypothetical protein n=1 Tax=Massilia sp. Root351 TaxID=1736522 RepID=UPI00070DD3BD|nr:hypothetical protein [Massilia sp. Root351]KQV80228.1 hypothetical protein ASD15_15275 [Massilia sp. Root351]